MGLNKVKNFYLLALIVVIIVSGLNSFAVSNLNSEKVMKNKEIPDFELKVIGNSEPLNQQKLLGKVYILEFWKTTCKPCEEKMPFLHDIYEKYKDKNFTIISVSFDNSLEELEAFRRDKWEMPWLHSLAIENDSNEIRKVFDVYAIPKIILVDQCGKVVCTNLDTNEAGILKALEEIYH